MEPRSRYNKVAFWNICAAVVVLGLGLSFVFIDAFHRSYLNTVPPGIPEDFPHYYLAGRLATLKPPENLLYYPPAGHAARSYLELRTDATTPYGRLSTASGLPAGSPNLPFDAPPFAALMMTPLGSLHWQAAYLFWQVLSITMMMASIYFAFRLNPGGPSWMLVLTIGLGMVSFFLPFKRAVGLGNIDAALLFLWGLGVFLFRRGQVAGSACCFALGTAIKISPIFALPLLAMRRQWRWLAAYATASAALLAFSVWRVGWQNHILWAGQVAPALSLGIKSFWNRSLSGFIFGLSGPRTLLNPVPGPGALCWFNKVVTVAGYGGFLAWCWKQRRDATGLVYEMILLPLVVLLVAPLSWTQYYLLAALPLAYLWSRSRERAVAASKLDLVLLTGSTLTFGCAVPEFVGHALGPYALLLVMAIWVAATLALIGVGMRMYKSCVPEGRLAVVDVATKSERDEEQAELVAA